MQPRNYKSWQEQQLQKKSLLPSKPVLNPFHLSFTTHFDFSDYFHCATAAKNMLKQQTKLKI